MSTEDATRLVTAQYTLAAIGYELALVVRNVKRKGRHGVQAALARIRSARRMAREAVASIDDAFADIPDDAGLAVR